MASETKNDRHYWKEVEEEYQHCLRQRLSFSEDRIWELAKRNVNRSHFREYVIDKALKEGKDPVRALKEADDEMRAQRIV